MSVTILLVDDDAILSKVLRRVLTRQGYRVVEAGTVAEALHVARTEGPDLGLVDLCLPDGDGVELARGLEHEGRVMPLILMTAYPLRLRDQPQLAEGFARVLTKPLNLEDLRETIERVLPRSRVVAAPSTRREETDHSSAAEEDRTSLEETRTGVAAGGRAEAAHAAVRPPAASPPTHPVHAAAAEEGKPMESSLLKVLRQTVLAVVLVGVVLGLLGFVLGVRLPGMAAAPADEKPAPAAALPGVRLVTDKAHTLHVPDEVRGVLGIRKGGKDDIHVAQEATAMRPLVLYGSTALDPTRLMRIRARFAPAEVVKIGRPTSFPRTESWETDERELRPGDRVKKGDELGVFFSVDVGSKKNDLLDALVQLELDQKIMESAEKHREAVPEVFMLTQWRAVQGDRNAINRALNNLKVWNIPQEEIDALHEEAKKISADKNAWFKTPEGRWVKGEKQPAGGRIDPDRENDNPWGKVTLRAPADGIIVERNIAQHEIVQDPTTNLFQIAQVDRLLVIANAPEDELPTLNGLKGDQRRWTVRTVGPTVATEVQGPIEEIGYLIDPNQHTAIIKGYISNPKEQMRAGQFVSATVQIPPPKDVVEVPIDAVVEDGKYCVVFVQTEAGKQDYTMRRVQLTHRFEKTVYVRSKDFDVAFTGNTTRDDTTVSGLASTADLLVGQLVSGPGIPADTTIKGLGPTSITLSQPATATAKGVSLKAEEYLTPEEKEQGMLLRMPLKPGDRILKSGVGELKAALIDLESSPSKDAKEQ
jgi:cobalt-zinc-cadmium efflux system membrane fusion protein